MRWDLRVVRESLMRFQPCFLTVETKERLTAKLQHPFGSLQANGFGVYLLSSIERTAQ
jgi:hypothetical protein